MTNKYGIPMALKVQMVFSQRPYASCLHVNVVDWFQPFVRTEYSVGAIYLTVQNLPRNERYKEENVLLVGILPGPTQVN